MATSIDGHILKPTSTPLDRLITEGYTPNEAIVWDLVNVGFLLGKLNGVDADLLALFTLLSNAMGVKLINENVALTGLFVFPTLPTYTPKPKERVLLISQTNIAENGFYEWQAGNLTRLWDWRDVVAGNGIAINDRNIRLKLFNDIGNLLQFNNNGELQLLISPNSHPALQVEAGTGYLLLDPLSLGGGGGGGGSIADIANPDVDSISRNGFEAVYLPNESDSLEVYGGVFRSATPFPVEVVCDALQSISYSLRKHNRITATVQANNLIGSHPLRVRNNSLYSNVYVDTAHCVTILGSAVIDTVSPIAKRNQTITLTVTGVGFALFSQFAANNAGISITLLQFIDRFTVLISVSCDSTVSSGSYNLLCTNSHNSNSFDSGTSGNNKLIVSGAPLIMALLEQVWATLQRPEVGVGQSATFTLKGFDFDNTFVNLLTLNIILNNYTIVDNETIVIDVAGIGSGLPNQYAKYDILVIANNGEDSGTSGSQIIGLNYPYDRLADKIPTGLIRAYGGTTNPADWIITPIGNTGTNISKSGGSGWCYIELEDIWFAKSVIDDSYGALLSFVEANIGTIANDLGEDGEIFVAIAPAGLNLTVTDLPTVSAAYIKFEKNKDTQYPITHYAVKYKGVFQPNGYGYHIGDYQKFAIHLKASDSFYNQTDVKVKAGFNATQYNPDDSNWFPIWASQPLPNSSVVFGGSSNPKLSVYVGMNGNFAITDLRLRGRVGY
jgi:hypothetical protein